MINRVGCVLLGFTWIGLNVEIFANEYSPIVQTTTGYMKGLVERTIWYNKDYYSFKGIPYAEQPIGERRFMPTVSKKPWTGILDATEERDFCIQLDFLYSNLTGSLDCLYLNVYSPVNNFNVAKATMVWIYGGGFDSGYKNSGMYGSDLFINEDVVLVTLNYRVGAFGFIAIPDTPVTGNMGLKDQLLALQWIKANIIHFGGNPEQITLFGQSAGGAAVDCHVISPKSQGLFRNSITQSATIMTSWAFASVELSHRRAKALGDQVNCENNNGSQLLDCLLNIDPKDVVQATNKLTLWDRPFKPTLEPKDNPQAFLTECAVQSYKNGHFNKLPHLMGYTKDEALLYVSPPEKLQGVLDYVLTVLDSLGQNTLISNLGLSNIINEVKNTSHDATNEAILDFVNLVTDLLWIAEIDSKQELLVKNQADNVYYYRLTYTTDESLHKVFYNISVDGVAHGDDFGYQFYTSLIDVKIDKNSPFSMFRRNMVHLWTNFAKYENPTPPGNRLGLNWPPSNSRGLQLDIGEKFQVKSRYKSPFLFLIEPIVKQNLEELSGCHKTSGLISLLEI